ncbi:M48 family peptidase [Leptospira fletcheri]|uniref:M48 family peptidase n=1 Tax=Leptospira fletcheri TaxID=2484981 RepID=A0A4R9GCA4_9LEPT|nr:M48 family metallopeptidase [Leptospira fletcheri]TGK09035.1 M48 family peptidase [Leptospira fletcheri]
MSIRNSFLFVYLLQFCFAILLKYLSFLGDTSTETHEAILKYFTEEDLQKGIEYDRRGFFASMVSDWIDFFLTGLLVFTPLSLKIEDFLLRKTGQRFYFAAALFLLALGFFKFLIGLPFHYYFGYVLEHRFGFSTMTLQDWILYTTKSLFVGTAISLPLGLGSIFILRKFTSSWKYIITAGSLVLGLAFSVLFPIFITPLFYETHPIEEGSLKSKIVDLCRKAEIQVSDVYVINESKYSGHTNAYFTGWGANRKIFLYDTLIQKHTEAEVISVLGHEIGHWVHNHQTKDILIGTAETFLLCFVLAFLFRKTKEENRLPLKEFYSPSSLPFLFLVLSLVGTVTKPVWNTLSRIQETQADWEALVLTKDKEAFVEAEKKLAKDNRSRLNPYRWEVLLEHSHPTTLERIQMAEGFSSK